MVIICQREMKNHIVFDHNARGANIYHAGTIPNMLSTKLIEVL